MTVNAKTVVERLIAELRGGHPTPQQVLSGLKELGCADVATLERVLLHELGERNRAGLLNDREFAGLRQALARWLSAASEHDDSDPTVEVDAHTTPLEPALPGSPATRQVELRRGSILRDRYVLGDRVASGGMSLVFRARDLRRAENAGEIAIKVLRDDLRALDSANARLRREFRQTQALQHPGVVRMFDFDCDLGAWFITMELLEGTSLEAWLKRAKLQSIDADEYIRIAAACADVLACAHGQGTVHGDFKPGNVFLERSGAVRVLDFGAAHEASTDDPGRDGAIPLVATRAYASPEVLEGQAPEVRDDVFSFACVVYEMLAGRHPFGRVPANEARDASISATPLAHLSRAQNAALASGLAWARSGRPTSVQALMHSLIERGPVAATQAAALTHSRRRRRRWRTLGPLTAAAVVAAAVLLVLWQDRTVEDPDASPGNVVDARKVAAPAPTVTLAPREPQAPESSDEIAPAPRELPVAAVAEAPDQSPPRAEAPRSGTSRPAQAVGEPATRVLADDASIVVSEGAPAAVILLRREGSLAGTTQVNWRLSNGTASAPGDFDGPLSGRVRFASRQRARALYVPLVNDADPEADETFSLELSSRSAAIGPTGSNVTVTIVDDDS